MSDDQDFRQGSFTIGGNAQRWTAEDLARFEERLSEAQAHLDEVSAKVSTPPRLHYDPRYRTLPEHFAGSEESLRTAQAHLDEVSTEARAHQTAIDQAGRISPEELARLKETLRAAKAREAEAEAEVEKARLFVDNAREWLPEDDEAEAQARVADAEMHVRVIERAIDKARADLLPEPCREALRLLAEHATDEWLDRYGSPDEARRKVVRSTVLINIEAQLATTMFRPKLEGLDRAINITGNAEPRPQFPDAALMPAPDGEPTRADQLADTFNRLRFGTGE